MAVSMTAGDDITPRGRRIVILCALALLALYAAAAWYGAHTLHAYAAFTARERESRLQSVDAQSRAPGTPSGAKPVEVHVALTMNRGSISAVSRMSAKSDFGAPS